MKNNFIDQNFSKYKAVIFDVDGTLYDLKKMHRYIFWALLSYYFFQPRQFKDLLIIYWFRRERERLARAGAKDIANQQYTIVAEKLKLKKERVEKVVKNWILEKPLDYLKKCENKNIKELIKNIFQAKIQIIYYSDYDPRPKVEALGLPTGEYFDASSPEIDALKPSPVGLEFILQKNNLQPGDCLLIGDRADKDGAAAAQAGMEFLLV